MPIISLVIPDAALSDAIAEQLQLESIESRRVAISRDAPEGMGMAAAVIIDSALFDPAAALWLRASGMANSPVFLLGEADSRGSDLVTESFFFPLRLGHLIARVRFHLEAVPRLMMEPVHFGPWRFEPHQRSLIGADMTVRLTEKETALLGYLAQAREPASREELLAAVWGYDARIDTHTLETHIYQLRRKLDAAGKGDVLLINANGAYKLDLSGKAS